MAEIKAGDLVQLLSGGPVMTVRDVLPGEKPGVQIVEVDWFSGRKNDKKESATYPLASLKKA